MDRVSAPIEITPILICWIFWGLYHHYHHNIAGVISPRETRRRVYIRTLSPLCSKKPLFTLIIYICIIKKDSSRFVSAYQNNAYIFINICLYIMKRGWRRLLFTWQAWNQYGNYAHWRKNKYRFCLKAKLIHLICHLYFLKAHVVF